MTPTDSIQSVLSQMRQVANVAAAQPLAVANPPSTSGSSFAAEMAKALKEVSSAQLHASNLQQRFVVGDPNVQLNDVMINMQKASIGFQSAVQVRNKLVTAYQTIASMPL